jgi:hypothetical protein
MAGKARPSFLKRQKEQQRTARAAEKREARRMKKAARITDVEDAGETDFATETQDESTESDPDPSLGTAQSG